MSDHSCITGAFLQEETSVETQPSSWLTPIPVAINQASDQRGDCGGLGEFKNSSQDAAENGFILKSSGSS